MTKAEGAERVREGEMERRKRDEDGRREQRKEGREWE